MDLESARQHTLDLVRGMAAVAVTQYHFLAWHMSVHVQSLGTFTVYMFFVLSALTMMLVYSARFSGQLIQEDVANFFRRRLARLLPLLSVVALVSYIYQVMFGHADAVKLFFTATGLMALHLPGELSGTPGSWSLGIELGFYAVFPVIALLAREARTVLIGFILLAIAQQLVLTDIVGAPDFWAKYSMPITFAPFFAAGLLIYRLSRFPLPPWIGTGATLASFIIVSFSSLAIRSDLLVPGATYVILTVGAAVTVWFAWNTALPAILQGAAEWLGKLSYSLYLTHWIAADLSSAAAHRLHLGVLVDWILFVILAGAGATMAHLFIERPANRYLAPTKRLIPSLP